MASIKIKTTVDYSVDDIKQIINDYMFPNRDIKVEYLIEEVGGDPTDRFPARNEVTSVRVSFDGLLPPNPKPQ